MLAFLLIPLLAQAQDPSSKAQINDPAWIKLLNQVENSTWTAGHNERMNGMTFEDARVLLGTGLVHISEHLGEIRADSHYAAIADPPASFDARSHWENLIHPIRNQAGCGSCWAFSASEVLSDRVAIATNKQSPVLSPEDMVACDKSDMGCHGGILPRAWHYLENTGIVTEQCFPYSSAYGQVPSCPSSCQDSESWSASKVKARSSYAINGVQNMMKEIMTHGPIQVAFKVYKSLMSYRSGVYQKRIWDFLPEGGHAVKIVGWGVENDVDYWIVANSWGPTWGEDGFFKIKRGTNECGIETMGPPYAGLPAVSEELFTV